MSDNTKRELLWLLPTVLLSMVILYIMSWQTGWVLRPGWPYTTYLNETTFITSFSEIAIYVFTHVLMLVYTARLLWSNFKVLKLNLVMLVVYGYVAYVNHTIYDMLQVYSSLFNGIMGGAAFMFAFTIVMMIVKAVQKRG